MRSLSSPAVIVLGVAVTALGAQVRPMPREDSSAPARVVRPAPSSWESRSGDYYENRGLARIERVGKEWALTILCNGEHTTYLEPTAIDPARFAGTTLLARYRYVERRRDVQCVQGPCDPTTERRIALDRVTPVTTTAAQLRSAVERCEGASVR